MPPPPPNPAIDPGFKPAAGPIVKCRNCRNAAGTDCHAVKADDGYVYCAKNCYWVSFASVWTFSFCSCVRFWLDW